jgi:hypothetical protein
VRGPAGALALLAGLALSPPVMAEEPRALFQEALRHDLTGELAEVRLAVDIYRRAAESGLPEAQFNLAVMLDSGRGVPTDVAQAAIWYARAASHGNKRAAFNLGQLYEAGQGVPRNADLARAWFKVSNLPAARARLAAAAASANAQATALTAPDLVAPTPDEPLRPSLKEIELVWTSPPQPEPVRFFVELREIVGSGSREIYAGFSDLSSVSVALPGSGGAPLVWRVLAVAEKARQYAASDWSYLPAASN